jgi:hypothetical protein
MADFNETEFSFDEIMSELSDAVTFSRGLSDFNVIEKGTNGGDQNKWVAFEIQVRDVEDEDRSVKGRLVEKLAGTEVRLTRRE